MDRGGRRGQGRPRRSGGAARGPRGQDASSRGKSVEFTTPPFRGVSCRGRAGSAVRIRHEGSVSGERRSHLGNQSLRHEEYGYHLEDELETDRPQRRKPLGKNASHEKGILKPESEGIGGERRRSYPSPHYTAKKDDVKPRGGASDTGRAGRAGRKSCPGTRGQVTLGRAIPEAGVVGKILLDRLEASRAETGLNARAPTVAPKKKRDLNPGKVARAPAIPNVLDLPKLDTRPKKKPDGSIGGKPVEAVGQTQDVSKKKNKKKKKTKSGCETQRGAVGGEDSTQPKEPLKKKKSTKPKPAVSGATKMFVSAGMFGPKDEDIEAELPFLSGTFDYKLRECPRKYEPDEETSTNPIIEGLKRHAAENPPEAPLKLLYPFMSPLMTAEKAGEPFMYLSFVQHPTLRDAIMEFNATHKLSVLAPKGGIPAKNATLKDEPFDDAVHQDCPFCDEKIAKVFYNDHLQYACGRSIVNLTRPLHRSLLFLLCERRIKFVKYTNYKEWLKQQEAAAAGRIPIEPKGTTGVICPDCNRTLENMTSLQTCHELFCFKKKPVEMNESFLKELSVEDLLQLNIVVDETMSERITIAKRKLKRGRAPPIKEKRGWIPRSSENDDSNCPHSADRGEAKHEE